MIEPLITPQEILLKKAKEKLEEDRKKADRFFEFSEKFIIWLIGFSIGAISLIIVNADKINLSSVSIKLIISLFSLTIILGIIYRILIYTYLNLIIAAESLLGNWFTNYDVMTVKPEDLSNKSIFEIEGIIRTSFLKKIHLPERGKSSELEYKTILIDFYNKWCKIARYDFDEGVEHIAKAYFYAYQKPIDETVYQFNLSAGLIEPKPGMKGNTRGFNASSWGKLIGFLFFSVLLSFMLAIIWFCIAFIST